MPFAIDFPGDGAPLAWSLTGSVGNPDWTVTRHDDYRPALYAVSATGMETSDPARGACVDDLRALGGELAAHPAVEDLCVERRRPGFRLADQPVLRIEVDGVDAVRGVARFVEDRGPPGRVPYRAFDVDLSPEFRFCLDREVSPAPARPPTVLELDLPRRAAAEGDLTELRIGGRAAAPSAEGAGSTPAVEPAGEGTTAVLGTLRDRLAREDPDVLSVERAAIVPLVAEAAREHGIDPGLRRVPPDRSRVDVPQYRELAGASTFESYGRVMHSPARYAVPGRVVIDRSNTFFLHETNLAGCLDLVERSRKPLGELAWASIGNVLTAIQIREARERGVLVQWRAWRPERFKTAATLHDADRGGTTLSPVVGVHEDVHELDFASLYPNIIRDFNLSPETVRCGCHDRADVPGLGYAVRDEDGYLPDVLGPLIEDRAGIKRRLAAAEAGGAGEEGLSPAEREALAGRASALKWILVSCFGYQGFSNAKFGRIEVHEAINAHAREIMLTAKERLEAGGWRVLHGIVDSIWVTPREGAEERTPLRALADGITAEVGIRLEREGAFDWVAFCPRRDGAAGALTRYFGRYRDDAAAGPFKLRGIECRQRSTCEWVARVQRDLLDVVDGYRAPEPVCDRLGAHLEGLRGGEVPPRELVVTVRPSKDAGAYTRRTRTAAALDRAAEQGLPTGPGRELRYVVVDDAADSTDRVRLADEVDASTAYDAGCYRDRAIRAAVDVVSPLGWDAADVRRHLSERRSTTLGAFR